MRKSGIRSCISPGLRRGGGLTSCSALELPLVLLRGDDHNHDHDEGCVFLLVAHDDASANAIALHPRRRCIICIVCVNVSLFEIIVNVLS